MSLIEINADIQSQEKSQNNLIPFNAYNGNITLIESLKGMGVSEGLKNQSRKFSEDLAIENINQEA